MRKQNKSQIIGREGERWFSSILPPQWSIQRPFDDYGTDGIVTVGTKTEILPLEFGVQIKSSRNFNTVNSCVVVPRITFDMLKYWLRKFIPTLLVAYDSRRSEGYCQWVHNLVTYEDMRTQQKEYCLHIELDRIITQSSWDGVHKELEEYESIFRSAIQAKTEILPAAKQLSTALSTLCNNELIDLSTRDGVVRRTSTLAWTYISAAKEVDNLLENLAPNSNARKTLAIFRDSYFSKCREIILDFDKQVDSWGKDAGWIAMKKPEECKNVRLQLNAMVSDCLFGLLRYF